MSSDQVKKYAVAGGKLFQATTGVSECVFLPQGFVVAEKVMTDMDLLGICARGLVEKDKAAADTLAKIKGNAASAGSVSDE
eukprot:4300663-Alexandrium_andersonii.AAC.1